MGGIEILLTGAVAFLIYWLLKRLDKPSVAFCAALLSGIIQFVVNLELIRPYNNGVAFLYYILINVIFMILIIKDGISFSRSLESKKAKIFIIFFFIAISLL